MEEHELVRDQLEGWKESDLANLMAILEGDSEQASIENIEHRIKWLYNSRSRANVQKHSRNLASKVKDKVFRKNSIRAEIEDIYSMPSYRQLIDGAAKKMKAFEKDADIGQLEVFVSHAVIIRALSKMKPKQRVAFFESELDSQQLFGEVKGIDAKMVGPKSAAVMLGLAQASGFGVYAASTTALGFMTHAAGIALPFAVYTGLTSTIAFVIGPAGWLSVGAWAFLNATGADWKKLIPAILYISSVNSYSEMRLIEGS
jgi:hypothetical protein